MADSEEILCQLVEESGRVYENRSILIKCTTGVHGKRLNIELTIELLEEMKCFKYSMVQDYCRWSNRDRAEV